MSTDFSVLPLTALKRIMIELFKNDLDLRSYSRFQLPPAPAPPQFPQLLLVCRNWYFKLAPLVRPYLERFSRIHSLGTQIQDETLNDWEGEEEFEADEWNEDAAHDDEPAMEEDQDDWLDQVDDMMDVDWVDQGDWLDEDVEF
jgi:hypothetical protein